MCQAEGVINLLKKRFPRRGFSLKKIVTSGDKTKNWQRIDKGIFVKEIEAALIKGRIDLAVHSLKDLPYLMPKGLILAAVTARDDPRDVLVVNDRKNLLRLKRGALVGTSSLRRSAQIRRWRRDLRVEDLRGNLGTRIARLKEGRYDAIMVAAAGIKRLKIKGIFFKHMPPRIILPAAGQGTLGIQTRKDDGMISSMAAQIGDERTFICVSCEREFLKAIAGGCRLPMGALAQLKNKRICLDAAIISLDGKRMIRVSKSAKVNAAQGLGRYVAKSMLDKGGREILKDVKKNR